MIIPSLLISRCVIINSGQSEHDNKTTDRCYRTEGRGSFQSLIEIVNILVGTFGTSEHIQTLSFSRTFHYNYRHGEFLTNRNYSKTWKMLYSSKMVNSEQLRFHQKGQLEAKEGSE